MGCQDYTPPASECGDIQCCAYNYALSYALNQYLAHPDNTLVNFSLIIQPYWYPTFEHGSNETLLQEVTRYASYFQVNGALRSSLLLLLQRVLYNG